jgi:hypothetical protein
MYHASSNRFTAFIGLLGGGGLVLLGLKFIIPAYGALGYLVTAAAMVVALISAYNFLSGAGPDVEAPGQHESDRYSGEG